MRKYEFLWDKLYSMEYTWIIPKDENRAADGITLRYRYNGDGFVEINAPCNVLEMLVALAIRCEDELMGDLLKGDKTSKWFWMFLEHLDLDLMTNKDFDEYFVEVMVNNFMCNHYSADGKGGLFWIPGIKMDMRKTEIWYQMIWFMNYYAEKWDY